MIVVDWGELAALTIAVAVTLVGGLWLGYHMRPWLDEPKVKAQRDAAADTDLPWAVSDHTARHAQVVRAVWDAQEAAQQRFAELDDDDPRDLVQLVAEELPEQLISGYLGTAGAREHHPDDHRGHAA